MALQTLAAIIGKKLQMPFCLAEFTFLWKEHMSTVNRI